MVTSVSIKETHLVVSGSGINHLIDLREGEAVLGASFIEVDEVHTDPPLTILPFDHHCVGQPVVDFLDLLGF